MRQGNKPRADIGQFEAVYRAPHMAMATLALALSALLAACSQPAETSAPEARPVRTITVAKREAACRSS
jgi:hypothetical protein